MAQPVVSVAPDAEPEAHALAGELNDRMSGLLQLLAPQQREVVVLRIVVGLSAEETGAALGMSAGQVRVAQHRGLTRLRKLMLDEGW
ncbi:sigma-70 family RNA polymerase sigma factor [Amycolatopsis sp. NPDC004625]|uniref:sigma-70 family RNA polymerase sigma factor n=1 Tax=Amycolatopsis sp. NPDC004625 TaxID=3154670 RepID=UPI0033A1F074